MERIPCAEEGLQRFRHQHENGRGQAKAKWKKHVLVEEASPTEAKEAVIDGDVEVHILEVDGRCPITEAKKGRHIPDHIHPERGVEKRLVEPLQVDDGPPAAVFFGDDEHPRNQAERRPGDSPNGMLCQER